MENGLIITVLLNIQYIPFIMIIAIFNVRLSYKNPEFINNILTIAITLFCDLYISVLALGLDISVFIVMIFTLIIVLMYLTTLYFLKLRRIRISKSQYKIVKSRFGDKVVFNFKE